MKNLQEIIAEAEKEFDKEFTELNPGMHARETMLFEPTTSKIKSFQRSLISRTAHLVAEKALEAVPDLKTLMEKEGNNSANGYPYNDLHHGVKYSRIALKEAMGEFLKKDV